MRRRLSAILTALLLVVQPVLTGAYVSVAAAAPAAAPTNTLLLKVAAARTAGSVNQGTVVSAYKWLINRDDAGDPTQPASACYPNTNSSYPDGCNWPSIHPTLGGTSTGVVAQGDNTTLNQSSGLTLEPGKYLISVLANGYKLDGAHFSIPLAAPGVVAVGLQQLPLPLGTVRVQVFNDNAGVNGQWDETSEPGLPRFQGHLFDVTAEVTTDWYGNPLCTVYQSDATGHVVMGSDGKPVVATIGGKCLSDANGEIVIRNLAPNRYEVQVVAPDGQTWYQTTTLEGGLGWETWIQEADSGYQTEVIRGGLPVNEVLAGFVAPTSAGGHPDMPTTGGPGFSGAIKGVAEGIAGYTPPVGGLSFGAEAGNKVTAVVPYPVVTLGDLQLGDTTVYVGVGKADGSFQINGVPDGDYEMSMFDQPLDHLVETQQVTVAGGKVTDLGIYYLAHWFGIIEGKVCNDSNGNGKCDPNEPGLPNLPIQILNRDNSPQDQGTASSATDASGHYQLRESYPLGQWYIEQAYFERFATTGVTYQCDNQPNETTVPGGGVDVNVLIGVGLHCRVDWAVRPYAAGTNGGIVGEVVYDTTRQITDARFADAQTYEAGLPNFTSNLYAPVPCPNQPPPGALCDDSGRYLLADDGSFARGQKLTSYVSEAWTRPTNGSPNAAQDRCTPRNQDGVPQTYAWVPTRDRADCLEAFAMNAQVVTNFGLLGNSTVNGNYGLTAVTLDAAGNALPDSQVRPLTPGDYIVEIVTPNDAFGNPIYRPTREEDVNVFGGDQFVPQVPPFACVGPQHVVHVTDPGFLAAGGSPYEGQQKPLCNRRLVTVQNGKSSTPNFFFETEVPLPGRFRGLLTDDLVLSANPRELFYGEKAGIPNLPLGIYDFTGRLVYTTQTDPNGVFELLMPSTSANLCPNPSSACPNVYRFVANDPGQPGAPNANYNPSYKVSAANFQIWPNVTLPADLAPVPVAQLVEGPGAQTMHPAPCQLDSARPQLFAVSRPFVRPADSGATRNFTLTGLGFGSTPGKVTLDGTAISIKSWSDRQIVAATDVTRAAGAFNLQVVTAAGQATIDAITYHVLGTGYQPRIFEVGPNKPYKTIQAGIEAADPILRALVVVYPNAPGSFNPLGAYFENIVVHSPLKLQGVGPGGVYPDGTGVRGSIIDGSGFNTVPNQDTNWRTLVGAQRWSGNQSVYEGETVYILSQFFDFTAGYPAGIDGFTIQGGDQLGFPGNLFDNGGGPVPNPVGDITTEVPVTQGGGIFVNAYAHNYHITNNVFKGNGGSYGGAIRVGTPGVGDNNNDHMVIAHNWIKANGGSNFAGAVGLFAGTSNYDFGFNELCGNFSSEYGGGLSHFGLSPNGKIHDNKIYDNGAYDEGGGIMIAGERPANPASQLSTGSGPVDVYNNLIQGNTANDDGGGLRFLMAGNFVINVYNNMIVNNVSTHEGGGVALDDATRVRFFDNTVAKNITTATAATSNGKPAPAGLSDVPTSDLLQATLPPGHALFSDPLLFDNIFWDNRAGTWNGVTIGGIGMAGDPAPVNIWDLGVAESTGKLSPTNSVISNSHLEAFNASPTNRIGADPKFVQAYDTALSALPWRGDPHFVGAITVVLDTAATLVGNYHVSFPASSAFQAGAASKTTLQAPKTVNAARKDIDGDPRPGGDAKFDSGADEAPTP